MAAWQLQALGCTGTDMWLGTNENTFVRTRGL